MSIELEDRRRGSSVVEDEEPLLPTFDRENVRKVEIGPWPLSCLLLQHLSRSVNYYGLDADIQHSKYGGIRVCYFPFLYVSHSDYRDELIGKWYKSSRTRWSLYPLSGYVPKPSAYLSLDGLGVWWMLPLDWLL
jgi:hypothetical protein